MGVSDAEKGVFWPLHTRHLQNGTAPPRASYKDS